MARIPATSKRARLWRAALITLQMRPENKVAKG
jgi:hypothetical protein